MQFFTLDISKMEVSETFFSYFVHLKGPSKVCKARFGPYLHVFNPIGILGLGGGGSPKGWVHNVLQFFTLGSSKIEIQIETCFFDTMIT